MNICHLFYEKVYSLSDLISFISNQYIVFSMMYKYKMNIHFEKHLSVKYTAKHVLVRRKQDSRRFPNLSVHVLSMIIRVKPSFCHTWLVRKAHEWPNVSQLSHATKMTKIGHIFNMWSWSLYLFVIWWKDNKCQLIRNFINLWNNLFREN